jgi:hypothetical protein
MKTYSLDLESYHDDQLSIKLQGAVNYLARTDVFLLAVVGPDGYRWQGRPEAFDWPLLKGQRVIAHNLAFDGALFLHHHEWRTFAESQCTANLCSFLGYPRGLDKVAPTLLNEVVDKDPRKRMKGKRLEDLSVDAREEFLEYNLRDAHLALELWEKYADEWPEQERQLSNHTITMGWHGVRVDKKLLKKQLGEAERIRAEALEKIPWRAEGSILSLIKAREHCAKLKIPAPASFAEDDLSCGAWETEYGAEHDFVAALRDYRKSNILVRKLEAISRRIKPNGRMAFDLKYHGTHTGRWSGSAGVNLQNLGREMWRGIFLRNLFIPERGKKFVICDLSAIEPRVLAWLARDASLLAALAAGWPVYEASAIAWGMWNGPKGTFSESDPAKYVFVKSMALGCGYGMGSRKFREYCQANFGMQLTEAEAHKRVALYRSKNAAVVRFWQKLETLIGMDWRQGQKESQLSLPSGRVLHYRDLKYENRSLVATINKHDGYRPTRIWGGVLTENAVSAVARDVFAEGILRLEAAGFRVVMHSHDEVVVETDKKTSGEEIKRLMTITPAWAEGLPLAAKIQEVTRYLK